ncbi:helix-turn-helix transcriptional regulator [Kyrpidia tusciae]|uniref:YheO domain protein n=1 Tax=Kyrpidia tusciae (strain DSM 2912 / NBRC 15312 / T2) TaxID=562970 RepID=D5WPN6_KYRT2|nr:PAS domain-containing protein [Kyrpidia tusciae]ADG06295.1 YheO domain protein [Kyrpidia tusciae DSM 2912]
MGEKELLFSNIQTLMETLGRLLGEDCEVVLHDFDHPERSIVAIINNRVTNRQVGDPISEYAWKVLRRGIEENEHAIVYRTYTKEGKRIRSTNVFLRDAGDRVVGCVSFNQDLSRLEWIRGWVDNFLRDDADSVDEVADEFAHDVMAILNKMVEQTIAGPGKEIHRLTKDEKLMIIEELDEKGAFLIKGAVDLIASQLGVSRYTIYNYLDEIRAKNRMM